MNPFQAWIIWESLRSCCSSPLRKARISSRIASSRASQACLLAFSASAILRESDSISLHNFLVSSIALFPSEKTARLASASVQPCLSLYAAIWSAMSDGTRTISLVRPDMCLYASLYGVYEEVIPDSPSGQALPAGLETLPLYTVQSSISVRTPAPVSHVGTRHRSVRKNPVSGLRGQSKAPLGDARRAKGWETSRRAPAHLAAEGRACRFPAEF